MTRIDHQAARAIFSQHLEGELGPEQTSMLQAHLDQCTDCTEELASLRQTMETLAGLKQIPVPKGFERKVQQRIRRRSRNRFFSMETLLMRIPYEWISFVIILLMLLMYFLVLQGQNLAIKPDQEIQPNKSSAPTMVSPSTGHQPP